MLKTASKTLAWAGTWVATAAAVWAGEAAPVPAPVVENDGGNEGLLLLVLVGAVVFAVAKSRSKPVEEGAPEIVDAEEGAGTGKY
jgi:hypothetical protein